MSKRPGRGTDKERDVDCNMKVSAARKREMDVVSAEWGLSRKEILLEGFDLWLEKNGKRPRH
jgi:hypothetical protein